MGIEACPYVQLNAIVCMCMCGVSTPRRRRGARWLCPPAQAAAQQTQLAWKSLFCQGDELEYFLWNYKLFHNFWHISTSPLHLWNADKHNQSFRFAWRLFYVEWGPILSFSLGSDQLIGETAAPPGGQKMHIHWRISLFSWKWVSLIPGLEVFTVNNYRHSIGKQIVFFYFHSH